MDHAKSLHYVGAGVAFPAGLLFVCLQCVLTYRVAVTALDYWMAHFRVALTLGAMVSLVLSILHSLAPPCCAQIVMCCMLYLHAIFIGVFFFLQETF